MEKIHQSANANDHGGSCHCGAIKFKATIDLTKGGSRCNCTICLKLGAIGAILKPDAFKLLSGEDDLTTYEWGQKISCRYSCKRCNVYCFARGSLPELGGAYVSVNLNTLDDVDPSALAVTHWDGRHNNWMAGTRNTPWPIESAS